MLQYTVLYSIALLFLTFERIRVDRITGTAAGC